MPANNLAEKINICLEDRDNIPGAPLWHMGKVALTNSQASFELMQNTIDYLTCKAQQGRAFKDSEKEFMKGLFEAYWWGGKALGYHEAARHANHYVNGNGTRLRITPGLYRRSKIVDAATEALKAYIRDLAKSGRHFRTLATSDHGFLQSKHAAPLLRGNRHEMEGWMWVAGAILSDQSFSRLHYADNQFFLHADTMTAGQQLITGWKVESYYDFESFASRGDHYTDIPLVPGQFVLKVPDGLSRYLAEIGVAKEFTYVAEWCERWQ